MRIINAFTLQRTGPDAVSGILDWLLSPYYMKKARPNDTLVLYTNKASVNTLGAFWQFIAKNYDEIHTDLVKEANGIFSMPKIEAMERELAEHGTDFIVVDNDLYAFKGFLDNITDYCVYHDDGFIMDIYYSYLAGNEKYLEAPDWIKWFTIPYNCAVIRINNEKLLREYLDLFYQIKVENIPNRRLEHTMIKEQWSLSELFHKYKIFPMLVRNEMTSFHKGKLKDKTKPVHLITIQEYITSIIFPEAYNLYKIFYGHIKKQELDLVSCLTTFLSKYEQDALMEPVRQILESKQNK